MCVCVCVCVFVCARVCVCVQVLVYKLDHFCPWTGTTIGSGNMGSFYALITAFWAVIIDCIVLLVYVLKFVDKSR